MRIIKLAVLSFIFLFIVLTGITFLIPSDIRLSKVVSIQAPRDSIFFLIKNKEQWLIWHPYFVSNTSKSNVLGKLKTTIVSQNDSVLNMQWQLEDRKPINTGWQLHQMAAENDFTLQWFMNFHSAWYPWQKLKSLFYENTYGKMMEQGLKNLKAEAER